MDEELEKLGGWPRTAKDIENEIALLDLFIKEKRTSHFEASQRLNEMAEKYGMYSPVLKAQKDILLAFETEIKNDENRLEGLKNDLRYLKSDDEGRYLAG